MYNAIQLNPFGTPGFAWMDIGHIRKGYHAPELGTPIIRTNYTEAGVPKEKLLVHHVRGDPLDAPGRVNVAGNSYYGTKEAFLNMYPRYYETLWDWVKVKNKFIGSDQFVLTETCRRYKEYCFPYFPGNFNQWFALFEAVMGKKAIGKMSEKYLFLDQAPSDLVAVPVGKKVTYCNGEVIAVDDASKCIQ